MPSAVDLQGLAIDRGQSGARVRNRRFLVTRYFLPLLLIAGFLSLMVWAARDLLFPPKPVTVMPVISTTAGASQHAGPLFQAAGWVEPRPTPVHVAALAPGVVEKLLVVEDQRVEAGEAIAELVKDDAMLVYQRALADLKLREAELDEAQSDLRAAQTRYQQPVHLQAALGEAEAALAQRETQLKNLPYEIRQAAADLAAAQNAYDSKLASQGAVAGVQIEIAKSKLDSAEAVLEGLRDRQGSLEREVAALRNRRDALKLQLELLADELQAKEGAQAKVKAAQAGVERGRVMVAEAKLQLDRMTIRAPIDGRVYRLIAHPGTRLGSGTAQATGHDGGTVITMYRPEMLQVRVDVRFEDIPKVGLGQPVEIDNPALPDPILGKVLFISSEADIQKNTLEVKVEIPDPPAVFKPEMLVDVTFLAPEDAQGAAKRSQALRLYVPRQLIRQDDSGATSVWVADQSEGVARRINVETEAAARGGLVEIRSGLTITSRLIVSPTEGLEDGERIVVRGEESTLSQAKTL